MLFKCRFQALALTINFSEPQLPGLKNRLNSSPRLKSQLKSLDGVMNKHKEEWLPARGGVEFAADEMTRNVPFKSGLCYPRSPRMSRASINQWSGPPIPVHDASRPSVQEVDPLAGHSAKAGAVRK